MFAMASISVLVKTLPTGLCGVFSTIIFVLGVIARLKHDRSIRSSYSPTINEPELINVDSPVVPCWLVDTSRVWVEGNVNRNTSIKRDGGKVLVEEWFEQDDFIPMLQECHEDGVLTWG